MICWKGEDTELKVKLNICHNLIRYFHINRSEFGHNRTKTSYNTWTCYRDLKVQQCFQLRSQLHIIFIQLLLKISMIQINIHTTQQEYRGNQKWHEAHARVIFSSALHDCMDSTEVREKLHDHSVWTTRVRRMVADLKHREGLLYSSFVLGWHWQKINSIL